MTFPENQQPLSEYAARGVGRAYPRTEKHLTHVATNASNLWPHCLHFKLPSLKADH